MTKPQGPGQPPPPVTKDRPGSASIHETSWDDDTVPHLDFDERAFDRVTAIPAMPPELFAKQVMEAAAAAETAVPEPDPQAALVDVPPPPSLPSELMESRDGPPGERAPALRELRNPEPGLPPMAGPTAAPKSAQPGANAKPRALSLELDLNSLDTGFADQNSDPAMRELADRHAMGDFSGALVLAEGVLEADPNNVEAQRYAQNCRDVLTSMYAARLGPLNQRVSVVIPTEQIRWLSLDHRAGFLLSLVDGTSTLEEILDISGMPRLDALRIMYSLREERVITLSTK